MELNAKKFALAGAETAGIMYIACAIVVALAPDFAMQLLGFLAHVTATDTLVRSVTLSGVGIGLAQVIVYAYISILVLAILYNRSVKQG